MCGFAAFTDTANTAAWIPWYCGIHFQYRTARYCGIFPTLVMTFFCFSADWKLFVVCAWFEQSLCLVNRFWKNCAPSWRTKYRSQNSLGCRKSRGWLPNWYWKSHLYFHAIGQKIGQFHPMIFYEKMYFPK